MSELEPREFNPLSLESIGQGVVYELLKSPVQGLPPDGRFLGSGVYALYYAGESEPYTGFRRFNSPEEEIWSWPIYVGKAVPKGSRKGSTEFTAGRGADIFNRVRQHGRSIQQVTGLEVENFRFRHLVVAPVWIRLAENLIIDEYRPVWNTLIDGFGNHDPGSGRYNQERSRWDTLHPGRAWAERLPEPGSFTRDGLAKEVASFLAQPPEAVRS